MKLHVVPLINIPYIPINFTGIEDVVEADDVID